MHDLRAYQNQVAGIQFQGLSVVFIRAAATLHIDQSIAAECASFCAGRAVTVFEAGDCGDAAKVGFFRAVV